MEQFEESSIVGYVVALEFERLSVQYPLGTQLDLGAHFRYEVPGNFRVKTSATGSD